jgi:phage gp36-like protein
MSYITLEEFSKQLQSELINLTSNDNPDTADDTVITECINIAESYIDSYLGVSYDVKHIRECILEPEYAELKNFLKRFAFVLARYFLYSRKNAVDEDSLVFSERNEVVTKLEKIILGQIKLPNIDLYSRKRFLFAIKDSPILNTKNFKDW